MNTTAKRVLVLMLGWGFILLGIAGLFLPVLQGVLFLLIGLAILSSEYVWAHKLLQKLRARFPKITQLADKATAKAQHWLHRIKGRHDSHSFDRDREKSEESKVHDAR